MSVCAVVVTYNRKQLLMECIEAILSQTAKPDRVLVIDNQSSDGTDQLFQVGGPFDLKEITYCRMEKNLGGAGGFYEGIRRAYHDQYDWIWIMDDDTIPTESALAEILTARNVVGEDVSFFASAVYGQNGEPMNVPDVDYRRPDSGYPDWYCHAKDGIIKIESATFVSICISRKAIEKVGFPYWKLFIWGDDKEYTLRLSQYVNPGYLAGKSIVIHKRAIAKRISIENETDPKRIGQFYYNYRNILINVNTYQKGFRSVFKRILQFNQLGFRILMNRCQVHRWKKIATIHKGIFGYLCGTYDRKGFRNRMKII